MTDDDVEVLSPHILYPTPTIVRVNRFDIRLNILISVQAFYETLYQYPVAQQHESYFQTDF